VTPPLHDRATRARVGILLVICTGGLALRSIGLSYGLPDVHNPDEIAIMNRALAFATGDLNPDNFVYPTFYFYALFVWEGLFFVVGWLAGVFSSAAEFERSFFVDPSLHFLAGRALSVACGVATIAAVYRFGAILHGPATGLVAAAFLAAAPIAVRDAHYVKHDVPVTLLIVLAHVAIARLVVDAAYRMRRRSWIVAGALAGLGMSTHYYAVFVLVPLALAAFVNAMEPRVFRPAVHRLAMALLAAVVVFFAASPFILLEPATVWRDVVANREIVMDRAVEGAGLFQSLPRYLRLLATDALGLPVFVAALIGIALALVEWRRALMLVAFPLPFLLFIANTVPATRYLNPVLPFLAVAAAVAVVTVTGVQTAATRGPDPSSRQRATARAIGAAARPARVIVPILLATPAIVASVNAGRFFQQADTRTLGRQFIEQHVPDGASILVQPYSVPLRQSRAGLVEALTLHLGSESRASTKFQRQLALAPYPSPAYRTIFLGDGGMDKDKIYVPTAWMSRPAPLASLRALAVEYVVLKRYNADSSLDPLIAALNREGRRLALFAPYAAADAAAAASVEPFLHNTDARIDSRLERPGPMIEIWTIDR
jgi:hypothetical protein